MKHISKLWVVAALLAMLPVSAFAARVEKKTVDFDRKIEIAGKQLKPGNYELKWSQPANSSATTNVTFYKGKKVITTVPARIVDQKNKANADFEFNTANGMNRLDRVYLSKQILEFGKTGTNSSSQPNSGQSAG